MEMCRDGAVFLQDWQECKIQRKRLKKVYWLWRVQTMAWAQAWIAESFEARTNTRTKKNVSTEETMETQPEQKVEIEKLPIANGWQVQTMILGVQCECPACKTQMTTFDPQAVACFRGGGILIFECKQDGCNTRFTVRQGKILVANGTPNRHERRSQAKLGLVK